MGIIDRFRKKSDKPVENILNLIKARKEFGQKAWDLTKKSDPAYSGKDERINKSIIGRVAHDLSTRGSTGVWLAMADIDQAVKAGEITYKEARTLKNKLLDAVSKDPAFKKVIGFGRDVKDISKEIGGAARTGVEYYGRAVGEQAANEYRYLAGTPVGKAAGRTAEYTVGGKGALKAAEKLTDAEIWMKEEKWKETELAKDLSKLKGDVVKKWNERHDIAASGATKVAETIIKNMPNADSSVLCMIFEKDPYVRRAISNGWLTEEEARKFFLIKFKERVKKISETAERKVGQGLTAVADTYEKAVNEAWDKKHYARAPFMGKVESTGWGAKGHALMDPKARSKINKGVGMLRKRAKKIYEKTTEESKDKLEKAKKEKKEADKIHEANIDTAKMLLKGDEKGSSILDQATGGSKAGVDSILGALGSVSSSHGDDKAAKAQLLTTQLQQSYDQVEKRKKEIDELEKQESDRKKIEGMIVKPLLAEAGIIAEELELTQEEHKEYLRNEARKLAYYYARQYRNFISKKLGDIAMVTRGAAMGAMTWGDAWGLLWENLRSLLFGPWIWGTLIVVLQWFFVMAYIQTIAPSPFYFILPLVTGFLVFMLNIQASKYPWDWLTHIVSGVMIGFSALIFLIAIWTPTDLAEFTGVQSWMFFWIIWAFLALFIGVFQLYHSGGFLVVFQMSIIIMIFGYIALGPYSGYYNLVLDQVKEPLKVAWLTVSNAVKDLWMLTTNPTEWYARQQVVNVKPEQPISYPKALEVTTLDAIPATVPGYEEFSIVAIIRNDGKSSVRDITLSYDCGKVEKNYCDDENVVVAPFEYLYGNFSLYPSQTDRITMSGFVAVPREGREAEMRRANVAINLNYTYSTNASLMVEVASRDEINRRQYETGEVFHNVLAVDAGTTARLSINVGPQPLQAGQEATVLISVSNTRDDGNVILRKSEKSNLRNEIKVIVDPSIGTLTECHGSQVKCVIEPGSNNASCSIDPVARDSIIIKPYDFNSILPLFCTVAVWEDIESRTGLIRAELNNYTFSLEKKQTIQLTPPLGIIYDDGEGGGEGTDTVASRGRILHIKADPADEPTSPEIYAFHLVDDPSHGQANEDKIDLSGDFCNIYAVDEQWLVADKKSYWHIKPGGKILKDDDARICDGLSQDCNSELDIDYVDYISKPSELTGTHTIGALPYADSPGEQRVTDCSADLLKRVAGDYLWQPLYELICDNEGYWNACTDFRNGTIIIARDKEYLCKDYAWIACENEGDEETIIEYEGELKIEHKYYCKYGRWLKDCEIACEDEKVDRDDAISGICLPEAPTPKCDDTGESYCTTRAAFIYSSPLSAGYCSTGLCYCYAFDECCLKKAGGICVDGVCQ